MPEPATHTENNMPDLTTLTAVLESNPGESFRVRQRICALFLGTCVETFGAKELRDIAKDNEAYNSPNFTRNMKMDGHLYEGDRKAGWSLSLAGRQLAAEYFPATEPVAAVVVAEPEPEVEESIDSSVLDAINEIPEAVADTVVTPQEAQEAAQATKPAKKAPAVMETANPFSYAPKVYAKELLADLFNKIKADDKKAKKSKKKAK